MYISAYMPHNFQIYIIQIYVSHHMNPGCVSPASASTSGVFAKSLAAKNTLKDDAMLHFLISICGQLRDSVTPPLKS